MKITASEILDLASKPQWTGVTAGRVKAMLRRTSGAREGAVVERVRFLEEAAAIPRSPSPTYVHPAETTAARSYRRDKDAVELTSVELMWLQRLPLNPQDVTHDDAQRLAGLAGSISRMKSPASYQLVESVWRPVRELHDQHLAAQRLEMAKHGIPALPESVRGALAEAIHEEHPDWPRGAAYERAGELLAERQGMREREHAVKVRTAEARVQEIEAAASDRRVLVREIA